MLYVAFLWHMHQPYYVDWTPTHTGGKPTALMPWVRLHAIKGYLDMVTQAERFPEARLNFNLTPVLIRQILELSERSAIDLWERWTVTPAAELTPEIKRGILANFFSAHPDNMVRPYPRYASLLKKRGAHRLSPAELERAAASFSTQDFLDLQVWFNLTWCGYAACEMFPELVKLKKKDHGFSESDKALVLDCHHRVMTGVVERYRKVSQAGQVELTTTPFFHPILPLVMDTDFARRNLPQSPLPPRFACPEDAREQVRSACELHTKVFGSAPRGLWPSEGSVCPEMIPILQENGIEWFVTDEAILFKSLAMEGAAHPPHMALFQPYNVKIEAGEKPVTAVFRDRGLSDFIGFVASRNPPERAIDFLINNLHRIADETHGKDALVTIALDGENAWEHFADGGKELLGRLYTAMTTDTKFRTTTISEYLREHKPAQTLHRLHTGSWIHADFDIWIGSPEENRAWELLAQTRRAVEPPAQESSHVAPEHKAVMDAIYAAEGSDWFWWYGDDFVSDNIDLFDELFRAHLRHAYFKAKLTPPATLQRSLRRTAETLVWRPPLDLVQPVLDGRATSFFEWYQAGRYLLGRTQGAMHRSDRLVSNLYFGFDLENLYFRVDFTAPLPVGDNPCGLRLCLARTDTSEHQPRAICFVLPELKLSERTDIELSCRDVDRNLVPLAGAVKATYALQEILEVKIPFSAGFRLGETVGFSVEIVTDGIEKERYPSSGTLPLTLPDTDFETRNWHV